MPLNALRSSSDISKLSSNHPSGRLFSSHARISVRNSSASVGLRQVHWNSVAGDLVPQPSPLSRAASIIAARSAITWLRSASTKPRSTNRTRHVEDHLSTSQPSSPSAQRPRSSQVRPPSPTASNRLLVRASMSPGFAGRRRDRQPDAGRCGCCGQRPTRLVRHCEPAGVLPTSTTRSAPSTPTSPSPASEPTGDVCFVNNGSGRVGVVADHLGTIDATAYTPATTSGAPMRAVDTRANLGGSPPHDRRPRLLRGRGSTRRRRRSSISPRSSLPEPGTASSSRPTRRIHRCSPTSTTRSAPSTRTSPSPRIGTDGRVCYVNAEEASVDLVARPHRHRRRRVVHRRPPRAAHRSGWSTPAPAWAAAAWEPAPESVSVWPARQGTPPSSNLTPVRATESGNGQLVSSDAANPPVFSNVNYRQGSIDPNVAIAPIGTDGQVCFVNNGGAGVDLIADHIGTVAASAYTPAPSRRFTRPACSTGRHHRQPRRPRCCSRTVSGALRSVAMRTRRSPTSSRDWVRGSPTCPRRIRSPTRSPGFRNAGLRGFSPSRSHEARASPTSSVPCSEVRRPTGWTSSATPNVTRARPCYRCRHE